MSSKKHKDTFKKTSLNTYEQQRYRNKPLLLILILVEAVMIYLVAEEIAADNLWGQKMVQAWTLLAITVLVTTPLLIGFFIIRLESIVSEDGIFFRWLPFKSTYHMILWDGIRDIALISMQKKGHSWRFSGKYDEVNFPGSDFAMEITMKSGRRRLLGTRKPEEINRILSRLAGEKYLSKKFEEQYGFD
jgi:hypothetical protein